MFGEPNLADGRLHDRQANFNRLKDIIISQLQAAYPNHSSTYVVKSFSVRLEEHEGCCIAMAIAELRLPESLGDDVYDTVLEDDFIWGTSPYNIEDALLQLGIKVLEYVDQAKRDPYNPVTVQGFVDINENSFW